MSDLSQIVREMNQAMLMGGETRNAPAGVHAREGGQTPAGGAGRTIQPAVGRPSGKKASLASTDGVGTELCHVRGGSGDGSMLLSRKARTTTPAVSSVLKAVMTTMSAVVSSVSPGRVRTGCGRRERASLGAASSVMPVRF